MNCPEAVLEYTKRMGGVDRLDERRGRYSVSRRSRRWWLRIFYFLVDCCVVDAHILYNSVHPGETITMLEFRQQVFRGLVADYRACCRRSNLSGCAWIRRRSIHAALSRKPKGVPEDIRMRAVGVHMPVKLPNFRRCRLCSTRTRNKRSRIACNTCQVALCVTPCFADFHK